VGGGAEEAGGGLPCNCSVVWHSRHCSTVEGGGDHTSVSAEWCRSDAGEGRDDGPLGLVLGALIGAPVSGCQQRLKLGVVRDGCATWAVIWLDL
jgi:hypothetical protein